MAYIKKEPIVEFITKGLNNPDKTKAYGYDAIEILAEIEYSPTTDVVEVKQGEWVLKHGIYVCSNCDATCPYDVIADEFSYWACNYCPHCGAKMDGKALKEREKE